MPCAGHPPLLLPLNTSLGHWTDHAARTGKVRPASGLGLRAVRPRIPAYAGHTRPGPGATNSLLRRSCADGSWNCSGEVPSCVGPPPGLRRGWNVDEVLRGGGTRPSCMS